MTAMAGSTVDVRKGGLRTILAFRARVDRVTPAVAAQRIAAGYGSWQRWAGQHQLTVDEVREVVADLTGAAEVGSRGR